ncbi:MAG: M20/M25/M40 family metallo-hydrolase, partial [Bacteroidota bacterium]
IQLKPTEITFESVNLPAPDTSAIGRFTTTLRIPTISHENPEGFDSIPFLDFITYLENTYPLADSILEKKIINRFSLLYKWAGKNLSLKPVVFMGHIDVVPVAETGKTLSAEKSTRLLQANINSTWEVAPFSGEIKDGFIWGRGAIDDKISVIGNMESIEKLLQEDFQPERTIYFAFGHDEETWRRSRCKRNSKIA